MYENQLQHLADELRFLDLLLLRQLHILRESCVKATGAHGLFISPEEVISLLNPSVETFTDGPLDSAVDSINKELRELRDAINGKLSDDEAGANNLPLMRLAMLFGLEAFEVEALIIALAPEVDKKYEKIYAFLNDNATKRRPSVSVVLDTLCTDKEEKIKGWRYFSPDASLLRFNLVHFTTGQNEGSFPDREIALEDRIKRFIAGDNGIDSGLSQLVQILHPYEDEAPEAAVRVDIKDRVLERLEKGKDQNIGKQVIWLYGKAREDMKAVAQGICRETELPLLTADLEELSIEPDLTSAINNLFREAALRSALVFLAGGDCLYERGEKALRLRRALLRAMNNLSWVTFIGAEALWMPEDGDWNLPWHPFELDNPVYAERKKIWADALSGSGNISGADVEILSGRFNFSECRIRNSVSYAKRFAGEALSFDDVYAACKNRSDQRASVYSKKLRPHYRWDDIALPEDTKCRLRELGSYIKYKHVVYGDWGFEKKLSLGKGVNVLFSGASGTGKTMAAEIISNDLKLDIYKIDLSQVVSKYIGETEKNLSAIFREAETLNAIIFFDEADALFGKRSEVRDSHDRYANIETGYLLQKMEEHEGVVILATNFSKNMDGAFLRRMQFIVEFPFPDEELRERIWRNIFPEGAFVGKLDFDFLADKFKLAGGNIKNVAVHAAFLAAANSGRISMEHVMQAVTREYQKMGCSVSNVMSYEQAEETP